MRSKFAQWLIGKASQWLLYQAPRSPSPLVDFEKIRFEVRPADVILVEGHNRVSRVIKQITQSTWSHAVLYIGRLYDIDDPALREKISQFYQGPPDEQLIIESIMGSGTIVNTLSNYKGAHIRICRARGLSRIDAQKVIGFAINHLGMRYSVRHIFDLARLLFPWGVLPRRWRSSLFTHNALKPTEEICSSLIARAFQAVSFPIIPEIKEHQHSITLVSQDARLFTPKDFDYSPFFDIIKSPTIAPIFDLPYRDLPWQHEKEQDSEMPSVETKKTQPTSPI